MAEILIFNKLTYIIVLIGSFPIIAQAVSQHPLSILSNSIVILLMLITLLPQLMLVSRPYRQGLVSGIQDADGKTNREDLRFVASWAIPLLSFQALVFINLFSLVSERDINSATIWSLVAVITGTAIPKVQEFIKGDVKK